MIKTNKLPSEYQEVKYITSNGADYLDTGFVPNNNTKIEVKMKASQDINNIWVFGARQSANNVMYAAILHYDNNTSPLKIVRSDYGTGNESDGAIRFYNTNKNLTQNIITIVKDKNYFYVDNILVGTHTSQAFTCVNNLYLFKINSANGGNHSSYISMYYAKIWDNDTLIRHYIPCYRKSDNAIGMYDLVNKTFTAGTGNFTKGSNIEQHTVKKITTKVNNTRLPDTYQEVKYIESTGGQYIDTGYTPAIGDSIEVRNVNWTNGALIYAGLQSDTYQIAILHLENVSQFDTYFKYFGSGDAEIVPTFRNGPYKIKMMGDGTLLVNDKFASKNTPTGSVDKHLFIGRRQNSENVYFVGSYGEVIVTNSSNVVVRDLIPCYRKSDNVVGMYDLANNVFYTNGGSGSFTKGPNISSQVDIKYIKTKHNNTMVEVFNDNFNNYQEVEYLNFNGRQAIRPLSIFTPTFGKFYMKIYQPQSSNMQYLIFGYTVFTNDGTSVSAQDANLYTNGSYLSWKYRGNSTITNPINISNILEITLDNTNKKMTINGTDYAFSSSYNNACAYCRAAFMIGGEVYQERNMFNGRMYNFKHYDDGGNNLLLDLVPCYRKSDNKPGMYDKVHNTFYTNVGTGDFTVGPDV